MKLIKFTAHYQKMLLAIRSTLGNDYTLRSESVEGDGIPDAEQIRKAADKAAIFNGLGASDFVKRLNQRFIQQEVGKQKNIDSILDKSINYLKDDTTEEAVGQDWKNKFFSKAQDISSETVQEIWAKIFADEVAKPGSISPRTLDILSSLSRNEAVLFRKLLTMTHSYHHVFKIGNKNNLNDFGITYDNLLTLRAAGLVFEGDTQNYGYGVYNSADINLPDNIPAHVRAAIIGDLGALYLDLGTKKYKIVKQGLPKGASEYRFDVYTLTTSGVELARVIKVEFDQKYFDAFASDLKTKGYKVESV